MYSIKKAAGILRRSESTVRNWMKLFNIEGIVVPVDRKRIYLTYEDMLILVDYLQTQITEQIIKEHPQNEEHQFVVLEGKDLYTDYNTGEYFYSLTGVKSLLHIASTTLRDWIKKHNISTIEISSDRKRTYIVESDVFRLADIYQRDIAIEPHTAIPPQKESIDTQPAMDKLYSIDEAASYLHTSRDSLTRWLAQANIERKKYGHDRKRAYITHEDVLRIAELHKRGLPPQTAPLGIKEEMKEVQATLKKVISDIEDLKHDFKLYIKKSIYIANRHE